MKADFPLRKAKVKMKKIIKRTGAFCCALALLTILCLPTVSSAAGMNGRDGNLLPDGIEYPMRRAVREGRDAVDDMMPDLDEGTVNDRTQGASDGVLDGNDHTADLQDNASESDAASENGMTGTTEEDNEKGNGMTTAAIVIACLAAVAIIVLIFVAIPKSKSKPGGTGNKN